MCPMCATGPDGPAPAKRAHVLRLLRLIEHPDALPADDALRLAREILTLTRAEPDAFRCEAVAVDGPAADDPPRGRRS